MASFDDNVGRATTTSRGGRLVSTNSQQQQQQESQPFVVSPSVFARSSTLADLCRTLIVAHFERYPAIAFGVCPPDEFEELIRLRHEKTAPKEGSGGLDGTGRMAPAISEKWLLDVEEQNEHLRELSVVDHLVWKDCVEYRFRRGGLTRPRALTLPWPLLIERIQAAATTILTAPSFETSQVVSACQTLVESPMNIDLLQASGVGKTIKKALKKYQQDSSCELFAKLDQLLNAWKDLAANSGVAMKEDPNKKMETRKPGKNEKESPYSALYAEDAPDLQLAQSCISWRQLFCVLKQREQLRRSHQGKRMREIRQHLASDRPKVVKVRPTSASSKFAKAAHGQSGGSGWGQQQASSPASNKMNQLRKESCIMASRQKCTPAKALPTSKSSSFGAAVAFASVSSKKRNTNKTVQLAGGKHMKIPGKVVQGGGGQPRQIASKWKTTPSTRK